MVIGGLSIFFVSIFYLHYICSFLRNESCSSTNPPCCDSMSPEHSPPPPQKKAFGGTVTSWFITCSILKTLLCCLYHIYIYIHIFYRVTYICIYLICSGYSFILWILPYLKAPPGHLLTQKHVLFFFLWVNRTQIVKLLSKHHEFLTQECYLCSVTCILGLSRGCAACFDSWWLALSSVLLNQMQCHFRGSHRYIPLPRPILETLRG